MKNVSVVTRSRVPTFLVLVLVAGLASGCYAGLAVQAPAGGYLYTQQKGPVAATTNASLDAPRVGRATATSYLGLIGVGDASITAAMENGNISEVWYIDYETSNILGLYATYTVIVYGE